TKEMPLMSRDDLSVVHLARARRACVRRSRYPGQRVAVAELNFPRERIYHRGRRRCSLALCCRMFRFLVVLDAALCDFPHHRYRDVAQLADPEAGECVMKA